MKELIKAGKTVDLAIEQACQELGVSRDVIEFEIIDLPKKGFLGLRSYPAKVRVFVKANKAQTAVDYITKMIRDMGAENFTIEHSQQGENLNITLKGEDLGFVIGRRGETIDAIQYLTGLAINRMDGDYLRITIDSGNFREKREKTLESLAKRLGRNVVKTGRSVTLEPMNPYERRIIHATVSAIEGVTSGSIGEEPNRKVVISSTNPAKKFSPSTGGYKGKKKPFPGRAAAGAATQFRPNTNRKPGETSERAEQGEAVNREQSKKPYAFRPNTNTKADAGTRGDYKREDRRSARPEYREKRYEDTTPRAEVPRSEMPKEAVDKPLYAKIDLD